MQVKPVIKTEQHRTPCSPHSHRPFERVMVAVDDSEQSSRAITVAAQFAQRLQAAIVLINVVPKPHVTEGSDWLVDQRTGAEYLAEGDALLHRAREKMPDTPNVEMVLREGDPATEILNAAILYAIDLIIMGTHARGSIAQAALGSVALAVTQKARCPVMTVAMAPVGSGRGTQTEASER